MQCPISFLLSAACTVPKASSKEAHFQQANTLLPDLQLINHTQSPVHTRLQSTYCQHNSHCSWSKSCMATTCSGFCQSSPLQLALPADASLKRVSALITQAAALGVHQNRLDQAKQACIDRDAAATAALQAAVHAEPFSRDIFRLRCMDASRLGLSIQAAQGTVLTCCFQQLLLLAI